MKECIIKYFLSALFFFSLSPFQSFALDGGSHAGYMWRIFPFEEREYNTSNVAISELFELINTYIDKPDGEATADYPAFIMEETYFRAMHIANYNHRIWFHWGFRTNPKDYEPLRIAINALVENKIMTEQDRTLFWLQLNNDNESKKRKILDYISISIFGYNNYGGLQDERQMNQVEAIASLLCIIHYIGDLIPEYNRRMDLIPPLSQLKQWLAEDIRSIAGSSGNNMNCANQLISILDSISEPEPLLHKLEDEFSRFMLSLDGWPYSYQEAFSSRGFSLRNYDED